MRPVVSYVKWVLVFVGFSQMTTSSSPSSLAAATAVIAQWANPPYANLGLKPIMPAY
jgi:hypothetical protein